MSNVQEESIGLANMADAMEITLQEKAIICTDPPYYDNIDYADLSDFFYVWLRHTMKEVYPELFKTVLVPKSRELVASKYRFNGDKIQAKNFFEKGLLRTFINLKGK